MKKNKTFNKNIKYDVYKQNLQRIRTTDWRTSIPRIPDTLTSQVARDQFISNITFVRSCVVFVDTSLFSYSSKIYFFKVLTFYNSCNGKKQITNGFC